MDLSLSLLSLTMMSVNKSRPTCPACSFVWSMKLGRSLELGFKDGAIVFPCGQPDLESPLEDWTMSVSLCRFKVLHSRFRSLGWAS